jgi:hypothetical protein
MLISAWPLLLRNLRQKHGFFDLPDDIILRSIMTARKRG